MASRNSPESSRTTDVTFSSEGADSERYRIRREEPLREGGSADWVSICCSRNRLLPPSDISGASFLVSNGRQDRSVFPTTGYTGGDVCVKSGDGLMTEAIESHIPFHIELYLPRFAWQAPDSVTM